MSESITKTKDHHPFDSQRKFPEVPLPLLLQCFEESYSTTKKRAMWRIRRILLGLLMAVVLPFMINAPSYGEEAENLISNSGFEEGNAGWKFYDHAEGGSKFTIVPEGRDRKKAAKLTLEGPAGTNGCLEQYFVRKALGDRRYKLSVWVKCTDAKINYDLAYVQELPSKTHHWIKPVEWGDDWAQYSIVFDSAAGTTAFAVGAYIRHRGELLVDDFSLVEAPEAELSIQTQSKLQSQPLALLAQLLPETKPQPVAPKSGAAAPAGREEVTRFFKTHPNNIDFKKAGASLLFANRHIGLEFRQAEQQGRQGFLVARIYGIQCNQDFLMSELNPNLPNLFEVIFDVDPAVRKRLNKGMFAVGHLSAQATSFGRTGNEGKSTLRLEWKGIDLGDEKARMDMEIFVTLRADDPFAYWRFDLKSRTITYGVQSVYFPVLNLAPISEAADNVYIYPGDRGRLIEMPFSQPPGYGEGVHQSGQYPAAFNMQFQALYNKRAGVGIFLGTQDPVPHRKSTEAPNDPTHITWKTAHYPPNIGFANNADQRFALPYDAVTGPFRGDWWDACQIYRTWAHKQSWCRKGPTVSRKDIPLWYKEAPMFLMTSSWEKEGNVAKTLDHGLKYLKLAGVPLPIYWYSWKSYHTELTAYDVPYSHYRIDRGDQFGPCSNVHDGCYPKVPALATFSAACKKLREAGGHVLPYVCLQIYDQGPMENSPYAAEARPWVARNVFGELQTYGGEPSWQMCVWPQWWRDRLKETCVTLLRRENAGGCYLDTMHGHSDPCWWTSHGHSAYGGSAATLGMHRLAEDLRNAIKATDPEAITTGENPPENMLDVIDGKLYVYTLHPNNRAPLFATVYGEYIRRHGMELIAREENRFCMQAASLFVEGAQLGRANLEPVGGALSFDDPAHKEWVDFLGRLLAYYRQDLAKKFLCYGQLMRPLSFLRPSPMPLVSYEVAATAPSWESSVANQLPALLSGVFRTQAGEVGVLIVNISKEEISFTADMNLARHGMASTRAKVEAISPEGDVKAHGNAVDGKFTLQGTLPSRHVTMFRLTPQT